MHVCPASFILHLCTVYACVVSCVPACSGNYQPTPTHHFIKLLHDKGLLLRCFSQNIDSLEHQVEGGGLRAPGSGCMRMLGEGE
jgi:NAD-dependent SIR2 family protein deacetylase